MTAHMNRAVVAALVLCVIVVGASQEGRMRAEVLDNDSLAVRLHQSLRGGARARLATFSDLARKKKRGDDKPVCFFLHGAGVDVAAASLEDSFPQYWGQFHTAVSGICTPKFIKYNTRSRGWDDSSLLSDVCTQLKATSPKFVVAHSMGNLVWSFFRQNPSTCSGFDATRVKWIALQGPFKGSVAAAGCDKICASKNPLWEPVQKLTVACDCQGPRPHQALISCEPNYVSPTGMTWAQHSAQAANADYTLCGNSPFTQLNADSLGLDLIVHIIGPAAGVNWGADNKMSDVSPIAGTDGMVPFRSSCAGDIDPNSFTMNPASKRYVGHINHAAGTGRDGEAKDAKREPITFVKNALTALASAA